MNTTQTAIRTLIVSLATTKSWRKHHAVERSKQRKNHAAFYRAFAVFRSECCEICNEKDGLVQVEKRDTATDPPSEDEEQ